MFFIENGTIVLTRGDSAEFDIEIKDNTGLPYILKDGDKVQFAVRSIGEFSETTPPAEPLILKEGPSVKLTHDDTKSLAFGDYVYDIQVTFANGDRDTIASPQKKCGRLIPNFVLTEEVNWQ